MCQQNQCFINACCEICGERDLVMSELQIKCNYGSKHDGERLSLSVCGKCIYRIYDKLINERE